MNWSKYAQRRFFIGVGVLYAAENLWTIFLLWEVLITTHSALWLAIASAAGFFPTVLVGLTGPAWGFRGNMAWWVGILGATTIVLAPAVAHIAVGLIGLALVQDWVSARVIPLSQTRLMSQTSPQNAPRASSHYEMASRLGMVAGPLLSGVLISTIGPTAAMIGCGVGLIVAAVLWRGQPGIASPVAPSDVASPRGWQTILSDRFLVIALSIRAGSNLVWPAFTLGIPLLIHSVWHAQAIGYGAIRTLWGLSTVLGTIIIVPRLVSRLRLAYFLSWLVTGLSFVAIGAQTTVSGALVWTALGALSSPIVHVTLDSHIGTAIHPRDRSAVYAIQRLVMAVVNLLGLALMSQALHLVNAGIALSGAGALMMLGALVGLTWWQKVSINTKTLPIPTDAKSTEPL